MKIRSANLCPNWPINPTRVQQKKNSTLGICSDMANLSSPPFSPWLGSPSVSAFTLLAWTQRIWMDISSPICCCSDALIFWVCLSPFCPPCTLVSVRVWLSATLLWAFVALVWHSFPKSTQRQFWLFTWPPALLLEQVSDMCTWWLLNCFPPIWGRKLLDLHPALPGFSVCALHFWDHWLIIGSLCLWSL